MSVASGMLQVVPSGISMNWMLLAVTTCAIKLCVASFQLIVVIPGTVWIALTLSRPLASGIVETSSVSWSGQS